MARPRNDRQGIQTSLYLTPERLDMLSTVHSNARQAVYALIDRLKAPSVPSAAPEPQSAPEDDLQALEEPTVPKRGKKERCDRCVRTMNQRPTCNRPECLLYKGKS